MGHEYVEMRNTAAAVQCYRKVLSLFYLFCTGKKADIHDSKTNFNIGFPLLHILQAVEVCTSDYRAWYGLGQTYEMLHLYQVRQSRL
jgi:hypothetical protein